MSAVLARARSPKIRLLLRVFKRGLLSSRFGKRPGTRTNVHRLYSTSSRPYFLTTPIFYANAAPHIGHLYSVLLADVLARWQRLKGQRVIFSTGTDEHGQKIQQSASQAGASPSSYTRDISNLFQELFTLANIQSTEFIRTTEERHKKAVQCFWTKLQERGYIYRANYTGWYSVPDETFFSDGEVMERKSADGSVTKVSRESGHPVTWMTEDNYIFRLSEFRPKLCQWLDKKVIHPSNFEPLVRSWLSSDIPDLSISRQRNRLSWGIPVPGDPTQTVYVWLDALINYLTAGGYPLKPFQWPVDCHIIGKDILKFHAVYWPAFIMAIDLEPPPRILCHSHWTTDGEKMSKSKGNTINPFDQMAKYSVDGVRYFLMKEGVPGSDCNYSERKVLECINSDLVNTLGNLLSRCTAHAVNPEQIFPALDAGALKEFLSTKDQEVFHSLQALPEATNQLYSGFKVYRSLENIGSVLRWANALMEAHRPWKLVKSCDDHRHLRVLLHVVMDTLRVCGVLMQPVIPDISNRLLTRLGIPESARSWLDAATLISSGCSEDKELGNPNGVLMKRILSQ